MTPLSRKLLSILGFCALVSGALPQQGVSSAAASRTRYLGEMGVIPASREIAVEEIINYHRHDIGRPKANEAVHLDVRWRNGHAATEGVLQIGFSTALSNDRQRLRPLNLALVIDKSGSMAAADKLERVKSALQTLVSQLRPTDTLSITVFDSGAEVVFPSQKVGRPERINELIGGIVPGSSTNLHGGLILGYKEALKGYRKDVTNRVILLTDGIANEGVIEPKEIIRDSLAFNDRGIDLSTIGVGLDLNKDLLKDLAKSGRGLIHFVADSGDIKKVFLDEFQSLVSPVAIDPNLEIEFGSNLKLAQLYGYSPKLGKNSVRLKLDNMNGGLTQVVMVRLRPVKGSEASSYPVTVRFSYFDLKLQKQVVKAEKTNLIFDPRAERSSLVDEEVEKNFTIAQLAQAMYLMATACEAQNYRKAESYLVAEIGNTQERYPNLQDPDIRRNLQMAQKFVDVLRKRNAEESSSQTTGPNLIFNGNFAKGNVGFTSALSYAVPAYNCLWPAAYTVAKSWNQPLLHRLHRSEPYASPEFVRGDEGVMFANAGGNDTMAIWTTTVKCEPNTRYELSFQSIALNDGPEWVPTYEIRVNSDRSAPQLTGHLVYKPITMTWESGKNRTVTVSIVKLPMGHNGGLVGIAAIKMVKMRDKGI